MRMIDDRNETTHAYDEATAEKIATAILTRYVGEFAKFKQHFLELEREMA